MKSIDSILSRLFLTVFVLISCIVTLNAQDDGHTMTVEMNNGTKLSLNTDEVKEVTFADGKIVVSGADLMRTIGHMSDSLKLSLYRIDDLERTILDSLITNSYRIENLKDKISSLGDTISRYRTLIEKNRNLIEYNKALIGYYHGFSTEQNHEYVDLGLSVKWATCNVGATKPEEYGDYFAWGDTVPYYEAGYAQENPQAHWKNGKTAGYNWSTYKWCNGSETTMTKYCNDSDYGYNGFTDDKTTFDPEDDVAHVMWGDSWRMPTKGDIDELVATKNNTTDYTWTWCDGSTTKYAGTDVAGWQIVRNSTSATLFLPAAGFRYDTSLYYVGSHSYYWSSSLIMGNPAIAYSLYFWDSGSVNWGPVDRNYGFSVRPVLP